MNHSVFLYDSSSKAPSGFCVISIICLNGIGGFYACVVVPCPTAKADSLEGLGSLSSSAGRFISITNISFENSHISRVLTLSLARVRLEQLLLLYLGSHGSHGTFTLHSCQESETLSKNTWIGQGLLTELSGSTLPYYSA